MDVNPEALHRALSESEERFRTLCTHAPVGIFLTDARGDCLFVNERWSEVAGMSPAEALGRGWVGALHPEDRERVFQEWYAATEAGREFSSEYRFRTPAGQVTWLRGCAAALRSPGGEVTQFVGTVTDVTEAKRAEQALRESETLYRTLGEAVPDFVWACGANGEPLYVNQRWTAYTGLTREAPGRLAMDVLHHPEDYPRLAEIWTAARVRGEPFEAEFRLRRHDGAYRWFIARAVPVKDEAGGILQWIGTSTDIHERKQAEKRLTCEHALSRVLAEADTLADAAPRLLETVCGCIDAAAGNLWEVDAAEGVLRCTAAWAPSPGAELGRFQEASRRMTFLPGVGLPGRVWQERRTAAITGLGRDLNFPRLQLAETAGLASGLAFPLCAGGEFLGVMEFFTPTPFEPDPEFVQMLTAVGHDLGQFVRRRRAEAALAAERERLRVTLASIGDAVIVTDARGRVSFLNPAAEQLTGWSPAAAGGRALEEVFRIINEESRTAVESPVARVLREGVVVGLANHTLLLTRDGRERPVDDSAAPIRDEAGDIIGVVLVFRDVTERRRADRALRESEERLRERAAALAEADRRKDDFLAMLAHELRNPLSPLRHALHLLRLQAGDAAALDRWRGMMERQVGHMTRLVDDLLDVSRINRGKIVLQPECLDLGGLIALNAADHRLPVEEAGLSLQLCLPSTPVWVMADPTRLTQVLDNLLENARKFTERGGEIRVTLVAAPDEGQAVVTVSDTGIGIEPEMLPRLFDVFAQADRSLDRSRGGLGLGLALVKGLMELHGGEVEARSAGTGQGAAFLLRLPLAPAPPVAPEQRQTPARPAGRLRLLLVEDNQDAAESLKEVLEAYGHQVRVAGSGPEGLKAAEAERPDAVICDIGLPGMDGFSVARALRQNPQLAGLRLIALTGYGQEADVDRARAAGFDEHLTKPVDADRLLSRLLGEGKSQNAKGKSDG